MTTYEDDEDIDYDSGSQFRGSAVYTVVAVAFVTLMYVSE